MSDDVQSGVEGTIDGGPPSGDVPPRVRIIDMRSVVEQRVQPRGVVGHQFNRNLLSLALTGTPGTVADLVTFPPGFIHHMHRHFFAEQIMLPLSGRLQVYGEDREPRELAVGQVMVIPRLHWHEARNVSDEPAQVFHFFSGVGDIGDIGIEMWSGSSDPESRPLGATR